MISPSEKRGVLAKRQRPRFLFSILNFPLIVVTLTYMSLDTFPKPTPEKKSEQSNELQIAALFFKKSQEMPNTPAKIVAQLLSIELPISQAHSPKDIMKIAKKNERLIHGAFKDSKELDKSQDN